VLYCIVLYCIVLVFARKRDGEIIVRERGLLVFVVVCFDWCVCVLSVLCMD